jgi:hypothetical protein
MQLTKAQEKKINDHANECLEKRKTTKAMMRAKGLKGRVQDIINDCAQHAPNHPGLEIGKVEDKIKKLEELDLKRNAQLDEEIASIKKIKPKMRSKINSHKDKYSNDIKELKKLLTALKKLPKEPVGPKFTE